MRSLLRQCLLCSWRLLELRILGQRHNCRTWSRMANFEGVKTNSATNKAHLLSSILHHASAALLDVESGACMNPYCMTEDERTGACLVLCARVHDKDCSLPSLIKARVSDTPATDLRMSEKS